jgi:hypothetical protein
MGIRNGDGNTDIGSGKRLDFEKGKICRFRSAFYSIWRNEEVAEEMKFGIFKWLLETL